MEEKNNTLSNSNFDNKTTTFLLFLVVMLLLGRAWQGIFWDLPLRTLFWDQVWLEGIVTRLTGGTWQQYVTNKSMPTDKLIDGLGLGLGIFWAIAGLSLFFLKNRPFLGKWILRISSVSLFFLAFLYFKERYWQLGQLLEYSTQVFSPLVLAYVWYGAKNTARFRMCIRILIATTFCAHALYAVGYYPQPGVWTEWCRKALGFKEDTSIHYFLLTVGMLDILASIALFLPCKWGQKIALSYCIAWGFMTALARLLGNFYGDMALSSLHQHFYEVAYRLVHGGLPLLLWSWIESVPND